MLFIILILPSFTKLSKHAVSHKIKPVASETYHVTERRLHSETYSVMQPKA